MDDESLKKYVLELIIKEKNNFRVADFNRHLFDDIDFVCEAINIDPFLYKEVSERLKNDRCLAMLAVKNASFVLQDMPEKFKSDKAIVMMAVQQSGNALMYAPKEFQDNEEIVLAAIKNNPRALEYASQRLRNDKEIVRKAIKKEPSTLKYASERLRDNYEFVRDAAEVGYRALNYASDRLRDNIGLLIETILFENNTFSSSEKKSFSLKKENVLKYASERFKDNWTLYRANKKCLEGLFYLSCHIENFQNLPKEIFMNESLLDLALRIVKDGLKKVSIDDYKKEAVEYVHENIKARFKKYGIKAEIPEIDLDNLDDIKEAEDYPLDITPF